MKQRIRAEKSELVQSLTKWLAIDTDENCKKEFKIITQYKYHHGMLQSNSK